MKELAIVALCSIFVSGFSSQYLTNKYWQNRLIEEQLAEWRVDPATGKVWFKTYAWEDVE